jgi:hypothetical protein
LPISQAKQKLKKRRHRQVSTTHTEEGRIDGPGAGLVRNETLMRRKIEKPTNGMSQTNTEMQTKQKQTDRETDRHKQRGRETDRFTAITDDSASLRGESANRTLNTRIEVLIRTLREEKRRRTRKNEQQERKKKRTESNNGREENKKEKSAVIIYIAQDKKAKNKRQNHQQQKSIWEKNK